MNPIDLRAHELHATADLADGVLHLALRGTADSRTETTLGTLLTRIHAELLPEVVREAQVDLRALEFMNSSCFKALITWIVAVDKRTGDQRYRIRFLCNPELHWQKRSLKAMTHFGGGIVTVETA